MIVPLHDPSIRLAVLGHLATGLTDDALKRLGLPVDDLRELVRLRSVSASELEFLAAQRRLELRLELRPDEVREALRAHAIRADGQALQDYFIRNGASFHQMLRFFSLSRPRTLQCRRLLGVSIGSGRPRLPDHEIRTHIALRWKKNPGGEPRERLLRLHQQFPEYSLAVLEWVIDSVEVAP